MSRTFDSQQLIADAGAGALRGNELRKAIKTAEEWGLTSVAQKLKLFLVESASFAGDSAPEEVRNRVAMGMSALVARGCPLTRTRQMLKAHGVIETINRIALYPKATKNFEILMAANLERFTAEAIVLDFPHLFNPKAIAVARKRLGRSEKGTS